MEEAIEVKKMIEELEQPIVLSELEKEKIFQLGKNFNKVWLDKNMNMETKKKIVRTVVKNIIVRLEEINERKILHFTIHWKGGIHTQFSMDKPATCGKTTYKCLDIIKNMGGKYKDGVIAQKLNSLGMRTGKGNMWDATKVQSTRYTYSIPSYHMNSDFLSLNQAGKYCEVSPRTIQKLVFAGVIKNYQNEFSTSWEIKRKELDSKRVHRILERLRKTRKLIITENDLFYSR